MESINLADLKKSEIKEMIAKLTERLVIIEKKQENNDNKKESQICDECGGKYTLHNKSVHNKTQKHMKQVQYNDSIRRLARSKTIAGRIQIPKDILD